MRENAVIGTGALESTLDNNSDLVAIRLSKPRFPSKNSSMYDVALLTFSDGSTLVVLAAVDAVDADVDAVDNVDERHETNSLMLDMSNVRVVCCQCL